jgi:hypothetical protein
MFKMFWAKKKVEALPPETPVVTLTLKELEELVKEMGNYEEAVNGPLVYAQKWRTKLAEVKAQPTAQCWHCGHVEHRRYYEPCSVCSCI